MNLTVRHGGCAAKQDGRVRTICVCVRALDRGWEERRGRCSHGWMHAAGRMDLCAKSGKERRGETFEISEKIKNKK